MLSDAAQAHAHNHSGSVHHFGLLKRSLEWDYSTRVAIITFSALWPVKRTATCWLDAFLISNHPLRPWLAIPLS